MAQFPDERQLVLRARSRVEQWTNSARTEAYAELFEGDDPILTDEALRLLDALDSALEGGNSWTSYVFYPRGRSNLVYGTLGPELRTYLVHRSVTP